MSGRKFARPANLERAQSGVFLNPIQFALNPSHEKSSLTEFVIPAAINKLSSLNRAGAKIVKMPKYNPAT